MPKRPLAIIEAPSNLGLMPLRPPAEPGVRRMPDALRAAGLHDALKPQQVIRAPAPPYDPDDKRAINVRNAQAIANYSAALADQIGAALARGAFPLVLGGDCSILLGATLALRRRGDHALIYVDGHSDFYAPEQSGTGGAAGMDLAFATGFGPDSLTNIEGLKPYMPLERVAVLANRADDPRKSPLIPRAYESGMDYRNLAQLRRDGMAASASSALAVVKADRSDGVWIHYDIDALDSDVMPAVDSPAPDGLSYAEAEELIGAAISHPRAIGLQVTIFDPDLDPTGALARDLSAHLQRILALRRS